jgi:transcription antitermination factor NusB
MRKRTRAREFALQILYQLDITNDKLEDVLDNFWQEQEEERVDSAIKDFTQSIVRGVVENLKLIDERISQHATNWQLKRMAVVERNILRLASFELLFRSDIPPKVSINEAVDLAKRFSGEEAGKFVNGILDKIKNERKT